MRNTQLKKVIPENAYEVWRTTDGNFTTFVLSKKQSDEKSEKNPYAIWYVMTINEINKQKEYGDTYVNYVKRDSYKLDYNPLNEIK